MQLTMPHLSFAVHPARLRPFVACLGAALAFASGTAAAAADSALGRGLAYVSNQGGDVMVIDLATLEPTGTISAAGKQPRGIGVTADGLWLVLAQREEGAIAVIDRVSGKLVRRIPIGENPEFVRTRGHLAFVSYEPASTGQAPVRPEAQAAFPAVAKAKGEVKGKGPGKDDDDEHTPAHVAVVDLDQGRVVQSILGGLETEGIEFTPDGRHIVVANEADNTLTVHEIATGRVTKTVDVKPLGERPRGIKLSPNGKTYATTLEFSNLVAVFDADFKLLKTLKTAEAPYGLAFDRSGERLLVAAARGKLLQVFDTRTWAPIKDGAIGARCWHFSFTPDDQHLLLACGRSNEVMVLNAQTLETVKSLPDKQLPWGVVTFPKSPGSLDQVE